MPYIEQLLYGHNQRAETKERQELARSAGMGADVAREIGAVCDAWGPMPELGLSRRVLMTHPLRSTMPSMRGHLYVIVSVAPGMEPLFHAVVVTDAVYSSYGRNPYCLARDIEFCNEWNGKSGMDRTEIDGEPEGEFIIPAPNAGDIGLIDEAVLEFILTRNLQLPLEQSVRDSERAMALIIACLPEKNRKELKFASFTTVKVNAYDIAGLATEGATFAGWQRLMMARIDTGVTEPQQEYKSLLTQYLTRGDLVGIARISSRHEFLLPIQTRPLVAMRQVLDPERPEIPSSSPKITSRPTSFRPAAMISPAGPGLAPSGFQGPGVGAVLRRGVMPNHGLDPTAASATHGAHSARPKKNRVRGGAAFSHGKRGSGGRFLRAVSILIILFAAGWVGTMWLEGRTLTESLAWAGLPGMDGGNDKVSQTGTLLQVVDVGHVYERALRHTGGKGLGLNAAGDKGRDKALSRLQSDATGPLVAQATLFVKLTNEGIQQSGRANREVERLNSLANQGTILEKEMSRLELAWYSLTTGVNWVDLGKLSDPGVSARLDSLASAEKGALGDVRQGMGTAGVRKDLWRSCREVDGMAAVVRLFQAEKWSPAWEKRLAAAAEKVSPSAGKTTRAYRNSAFAMLRLKRAERAQPNQDLPFAGQFIAAEWPSGKVKAVLPVLRREAGRFSNQNAPRLLGATLALYATLEKPDQTIDRIRKSPQIWSDLQANPAVAFDSELYGKFLGRLRYEAAMRCLTDITDPAQIPDFLYQGEARQAAIAFSDSLATLTESEQWEAMSAGAEDPFLSRWAEHLAVDMAARRTQLRQDFATVWADCQAQSVSVQAQAKAGYDWSSAWRQLFSTAREATEKYAGTLGKDPTERSKFAYLDTLAQALTKPGLLQFTRVTVRLDPDLASEAAEVQLELRTPDRGGIWTSQPFVVGPAAPAGTGWVGTAFLDWAVPLTAQQGLTARVVTAVGQSELLLVSYPSLAEGVGPSALSRPRAATGGSVAFQVPLANYWRSLNIPDLGLVF